MFMATLFINIPKPQTTRMFFNVRMDKQIIILFVYWNITQQYRRKKTIDSHLDGSQKHEELKRPELEEYILLHDSIYMKS